MVVDHLKEELKRRAERNPRYSIRAFARALNIHPSTLAAILSEKRPLTPKTAERLLSNLGMDPVERQKMISSLMDDSMNTRRFVSIEEETEKVFGNWYHEAILNLMKSKKPPTTIVGISRRLDLSPLMVNEALNRMIFLDLLVPVAMGWALTGKSLVKSNSQNSSSRDQLQLLDKAKNSLKEDASDQRDFSGVTFVGSSQQIAQAKEIIRKFSTDLASMFERSGNDDVYHLSVQIFPLTHSENSQS